MPYYRRKTMRKNRRRPARRRVRRIARRRAGRLIRLPQQVRSTYVKRSFDAASLTYTSTNFAFVYSLSLVPNYTEFTGLFDQYAICGAKITFVPQMNEGYASSASTAIIPYVWGYHDRDGGGPTTEAEFLERGVTKPLLLNRTRSIYCSHPRSQNTLLNTGSTETHQMNKMNSWIDCATPAVPHYGSYFLLAPGTYSGWTCKVFVTLYMKFRGLR